ncbi:hypothetical protein [Methylobacterium sp. R2-1]|nr:hypothetical protein [Methylobacterium sp. R2-1]MBB2963812.1 hypothetical protein [Methylobacterium sp. R2-1]
MSGRDELVVLALLGALTLAGALLWAQEGVTLWLRASFLLCL